MKIALLSDIHANREAFEAVLSAVAEAGCERIVILGDIVGYGADPGWCTDKARALQEQGAIVIRGNHDQAIRNPDMAMNPVAAAAIEWTRGELDAGQVDWLSALPMTVIEDDRLYVHADGSAPSRWRYVVNAEDAATHFDERLERLSFCGHIHRPALYTIDLRRRVTRFVPMSSEEIPLSMSRRWLGVMGAVGQPRDGNPAAAWALFDSRRQSLSFRRTAYDIDKAAEKIRAAGLPDVLAARLRKGE